MYVKFLTHKAREEALTLLLPFVPLSYYSLLRDTGKGVYEMPDNQAKKLVGLPGWRKFRGPHDDLRLNRGQDLNIAKR